MDYERAELEREVLESMRDSLSSLRDLFASLVEMLDFLLAARPPTKPPLRLVR